MQSQTYSLVASAGGASTTPVFVVDQYSTPCNIAVIVYNVTGSALYDIQHSPTNPWSTNLNTGGVWINNDALSSAAVASATNYAFAPNGIRMQLRAAASATATVMINQTGPE